MFYEKGPNDKVETHEALFFLVLWVLRKSLLFAASCHFTSLATVSTVVYFCLPSSWMAGLLGTNVLFIIVALLPNAFMLSQFIVEGISFLSTTRVLLAVAFPVFLDIYRLSLEEARREDPNASLLLGWAWIPKTFKEWLQASRCLKCGKNKIGAKEQEKNANSSIMKQVLPHLGPEREPRVVSKPEKQAPAETTKSHKKCHRHQDRRYSDEPPRWLQVSTRYPQPWGHSCKRDPRCADDGSLCSFPRSRGAKTRRLIAELFEEDPWPPASQRAEKRQSDRSEKPNPTKQKLPLSQNTGVTHVWEDPEPPKPRGIEPPTWPSDLFRKPREESHLEKALKLINERKAERKRRIEERTKERQRQKKGYTFTNIVTYLSYAPSVSSLEPSPPNAATLAKHSPVEHDNDRKNKRSSGDNAGDSLPAEELIQKLAQLSIASKETQPHREVEPKPITTTPPAQEPVEDKLDTSASSTGLANIDGLWEHMDRDKAAYKQPVQKVAEKEEAVEQPAAGSDEAQKAVEDTTLPEDTASILAEPQAPETTEGVPMSQPEETATSPDKNPKSDNVVETFQRDTAIEGAREEEPSISSKAATATATAPQRTDTVTTVSSPYARKVHFPDGLDTNLKEVDNDTDMGNAVELATTATSAQETSPGGESMDTSWSMASMRSALSTSVDMEDAPAISQAINALLSMHGSEHGDAMSITSEGRMSLDLDRAQLRLASSQGDEDQDMADDTTKPIMRVANPFLAFLETRGGTPMGNPFIGAGQSVANPWPPLPVQPMWPVPPVTPNPFQAAPATSRPEPIHEEPLREQSIPDLVNNTAEALPEAKEPNSAHADAAETLLAFAQATSSTPTRRDDSVAQVPELLPQGPPSPLTSPGGHEIINKHLSHALTTTTGPSPALWITTATKNTEDEVSVHPAASEGNNNSSTDLGIQALHETQPEHECSDASRTPVPSEVPQPPIPGPGVEALCASIDDNDHNLEADFDEAFMEMLAEVLSDSGENNKRKAEDVEDTSTDQEGQNGRGQRRVEQREEDQDFLSCQPSNKKSRNVEDDLAGSVSSGRAANIVIGREDGDDEPQFAPIPPEVLACQQRAAGTMVDNPRGEDDDEPQWAPIPEDVLACQARAQAAIEGETPSADVVPTVTGEVETSSLNLATQDFGTGLRLDWAPTISIPEAVNPLSSTDDPDSNGRDGSEDGYSGKDLSDTEEFDIRTAVGQFAPQLETATADAAADLEAARAMTEAYWEEYPEERKPARWETMTHEVDEPKKAGGEVMKQRRVAQASSKQRRTGGEEVEEAEDNAACEDVPVVAKSHKQYRERY